MKPIVLTLFLIALALSACSKKEVKPDEGVSQQAPAESAEQAAEQTTDDSARLEGDGTRSVDMFGAADVPEMVRVHFAFDSAVLSSEAQETLRRNAEFLRQNPETRIAIEGHTDERGTAEYNLALGERRAKSVRDYLVRLGVDASRLETVSYGSEVPLVDERTEAAYDKNRRAQFRTLQ